MEKGDKIPETVFWRSPPKIMVKKSHKWNKTGLSKA